MSYFTRVIIWDGTETVQVQDGGIVRTRTRQYKAQQGELYCISHLFSGIANGASVQVLVKCAATHHLMTYLAAATEGEWHVYLFEGPTITDDGTTETAYNMDRNSSNGINAAVYHTPTISVDGTELLASIIGSSRTQAGVLSDDFWRFKAGTNYLIKLINHSGVPGCASIKITCFEE